MLEMGKERTDFSVVGYFLDDFGSHPEGSADYRVSLGEGGVELGGHSEVGDLGFPFFGDENIPGFNVLRNEERTPLPLDGSSCAREDTQFRAAPKRGYIESPAH